ncbi:hypothetical protein [Brevundimonas diminuta]|uniref:hypothetical protein n=1 Tax=Brevundimonas diminuta TaxID=293 RepID=UPI0025A66BCB|nr:hypothetical protein [Brevundimonas diminuta]MDM8352897.1 hypothetical protein [Brevundimonas diminuta]
MTRAEAIKQVLQNLRVLDAISNPAAEDAAAVGVRLDQERARLGEVGLVWWDADAIPDAVSGAFCDLVASACQNLFGKPYEAAGAQARIAAVKSSARRDVVKAEYF